MTALYMKTYMRFGVRKWLVGEPPGNPLVMTSLPIQAGSRYPADAKVIDPRYL
jgi:hypothetical protein